MVADSEKRYKNTKIPHITFDLQHLKENKINLTFTNTNTTISSFQSGELPLGARYKTTTTINQVGGTQIFSVMLTYLEKTDTIILPMDYITVEGYKFIQEIIISIDIIASTVTYSPSVIIEEKKN